ncbi:MAG: hypothetical protein IJO33_01435 [Bacilli bacterium]|nr:hypothetical protein [Bacilli bacterium]
MKKLVLMISVIVFLFGIFLFIYITPRNYEKEYKLNNFIINEEYKKEEEAYYYRFNYDNSLFEYVLHSKYSNKRKLINNINFIEISNGYCFIPESNYLSLVPLCKVNGVITEYHLVSELNDKIANKYYDNASSLNRKYKSILINNLNNRKFLVWNYKSFYYIDQNVSKEIKMFDTDHYQIPLATKINSYLFIPNYDNEYNFSDAFVINVNNQKVNKWDLEREIYFESRVLGTYDKSIYLVDEKEELLYEIVPHKEKLRKIKGQLLTDGEFVKTDIKDIINKKLKFETQNLFDYELVEGKLYKSFNETKILLSQKEVTNIVDVIDNEIYYISDDTLYLYSELKGEVKLLTNFEWSFNNDNLIFIY